MALTTITKKVLPLSEIPKDLMVGHWLTDITDINLQEVHVDEEADPELYDDLDKWIINTYPELKDEESFFIDLSA